MNLTNGKNDLYFTVNKDDYQFNIIEAKGKPWQSDSTFTYPKCNKEELRKFAENIIKSIDDDWLENKWELTKSINRERAWNILIIDILEFIEKHSIIITHENIIFLYQIASRKNSILEIRSAIQLLGTFAELNIKNRKMIYPYLIKLLDLKHNYIRIPVVEAFWQSSDIEALPVLQKLVSQEQNYDFDLTLKHVIGILERKT